MEFTLECEPCADHRKPFIERFLHGGIYQKRPDVMAIAHGHSTAVIPFGLVKTPMRATYHNAAFLAAGVPVFDIRDDFGATDIVISSAEKGAALAEALGDKAVLLLRAHGFVAVAPTLQDAVFRAIFTEVSARVQLQAAALGGPIAALDEEEGRKADAINLGDGRPVVGAVEEPGPAAAANASRQGSGMKDQLVDAIRMLERAGYIDHNGHCSARRDADSFYINSGASVRGALTADDIVTVDLAGNLVEGSARPPLEYHIHSEVYRARPDVNAVMHTHPQWSTFLTMTGTKYQPVYAQGVLLGDIPLMDSPLSINTKPMGEKLVEHLERGPAVLLKAHGRRRRRRGCRRVLRACCLRRGETPIGSTWRCRSVPHTYSAKPSRRRHAKSCGRRLCSRRHGITIDRSCRGQPSGRPLRSHGPPLRRSPTSAGPSTGVHGGARLVHIPRFGQRKHRSVAHLRGHSRRADGVDSGARDVGDAQ
jgi:ribulose-5-phosphate 4-epimerase/fuculose-1-phosphate aldolase